MINLDELRRYIYRTEGKDLLEDAAGGYNDKRVAFIACNPHSSKERTPDFLSWINQRNDATELKMIMADKLCHLKYLAFKNLPNTIDNNQLMNVHPIFSTIRESDFISYLVYLARPNKKQYHYRVGECFKEILELSAIQHCSVYREISAKSIFLEMYKTATPSEKDLPRGQKPNYDGLEKQLRWLLDHGLKYIVLAGNTAHKYRDMLTDTFPGIGREYVLKVPSFSPMGTARKKWQSNTKLLKEQLSHIWNV